MSTALPTKRCACPDWADAWQCIRSRYGDDACEPDDRCECPCHDEEEDDA